MAGIRIADILQSEYSDFLEFCLNADKKYRSELVGADYVAFRSQYGISRERIAQLRRLIESHEATSDPAHLANDDSVVPKTSDINDDNGCTADNNVPSINSAAVTETSEDSDGNLDFQQNEVVTTELMPSYQSTEVDDIELELGTNSTPIASRFSCESELPLYQFFSVSCEPYINMPLLESDIGVRAYNSLRIGRKKDGSTVSCKTVGDVLRLSPLQLSNYKNMGRLSIERIISALDPIVHCENGKHEMECFATNLPVSADCRKQVLAMLYDESYDTSGFSDTETAAFSEYMSACEIIGKEMALATVNGSRAIVDVMQMLRDFYEEPLKLYERKVRFDHAVCSLPIEIKKLPVEPFIFAYRASVATNKSGFNISLDSEATVLDFVHAIRSDVGDTEAALNFAIPFVKWLKFDITALCQPMRDCLEKQRDNAQFVFKQRMLGETLEAVGSTMGVTRERIRQIEKKIARIITHSYDAQKKDHDILTTIYALRGGDTVLRYDEIAAQVGDADAQMIWYLAKKDLINCEMYHFSHQSNAVVFGDASEHVALSSLLAELPAFIEKSEMPHYIADLVEKHGVAEELLRMQLRSTYKRDGMFYHRGRLTVVFMCDYILRTRFPNGYKIADESDHKRFMSYLAEVFENKGKITARALDAKIGQIGVLIDRGKYIHPSYIDVDKKIIDDINAYIENSPRVVLTYTELFDTFSDRFSGTQINNKYCLQGALKLLGCPFVMRKDYITKESDVNLASEFEHFVEQSGRVHKSVLLEEFNGLSEINIGFFCQRLSTIVVLDGGYYMHASQLNINEDDFNEQRKFLLTACSDTPASTRVLYNEYMMRFTDFMIRNNIESQGNLFGVLQYMFRNEFFFSRPYISLSDDIDLTHHGVLLQHLSGVDSIEIEDLTDICEKNGIHFLSVRTLMESIEPDFIRVGKTMLMRKELTGVDDDIVLDTAQQIKEMLHVRGGYCASKNIDDFSWFPELNVPWNAYLLESVSALAGDLLTVLRINTSTIYTPVDIYIGDEFVDEDTNSLIVRLLVKESQLEPFASKEDVFYWLQEQGLCNAKLPSFLETEGHLFYDESGKLQVQ
ncbi:hypothetical protein SDC9_61196 [bioreactor metagenome]|uniref:Uncharacterized protein n=1 Tax=bioreactor metagenome TaxID=1076179 RepID=A0A644XF47_9ZZZZ